MIWYILITLFVLTLTWILFAPVILSVNSKSNKYRIMMPGILSVRVVPGGELVLIKVWLFFIPFRLDPIKMGRKAARKERKPKKKSKKKPGIKSLFKNRGKMKGFKRAITIKKLNLDLDTDDFTLNAWLIPVFSMLNQKRNIDMQVNFEGNLALELDARTRLSRIAWLMIKNR